MTSVVDTRVVIVGNITIDDVVHPDGTTFMGQLGGNVVYAAMGARLWSPTVGIVTRKGDDLDASVLGTLVDLGVDVAGVRDMPGPTVRSWLLYEGDGGRQFVDRTTPGRSAEMAVQRDDMPRAWLSSDPAPVVHVAPMRLDAARALIEQVRLSAQHARIVFDPHESAVADASALLSVARLVDVFAPSRDEARDLLGYDNPARAVEELRAAGVPATVIKLGSQGCLLADSDGPTLITAYPAQLVDPTGAGDTFCGALAGAIGAGHSLREAARRASATASWSVEGAGSFTLAVLDRELAASRFARDTANSQS